MRWKKIVGFLNDIKNSKTRNPDMLPQYARIISSSLLDNSGVNLT